MNEQFIDLLDGQSKVSSALRKLDLINSDPSSIQRVSLELLDQFLYAEHDLVDATNPFMKLLECSALNTASFILDNEISTRKQYESCAQTMEDLYHHMSDKDYLDRFASPSQAQFKIIVPLSQVLKAMVEDPLTGIKQVTIARNSEFIVEDTTFSIQYPIEIKELKHGGLQVVYNTDKLSPLQSLKTNVLDYEIKKLKELDDDVLIISVDATQFKIKHHLNELTSAKLFKKTYTFEDQYYHCRVYYQSDRNSGDWVEMKTTHSDQVYDINDPTAVLKVSDKSLEVYIPQVYFTNNKVSGTLRVDIYQTKGQVSMSLYNHKPSAFMARWLTYDEKDKTADVAAWASLPDVFIYSTQTVYGGKNEIDFETLRKRVMLNAIGDRNVPITSAQIQAHIENKGFDIVKNVDLVTNRIFQASKELPKPFDEKLITAATTSMESVALHPNQLKNHPSVFYNNNRITLSPDILYQKDNGVIKIVSGERVIELFNKSPDALAVEATTGNYLYCPFHYVLDHNEKDLKVRSYHLEQPRFDIMEFVAQNDSTGWQVNTQQFSITKTSFGYQVLVQTKSNEAYKKLNDEDLFIQMSFVPEYEASRVTVNGQLLKTLDDGERIFKFDLHTRFDIDENNVLFFSSFKLNQDSHQNFGSKLKQTFDVIYGANIHPGVGYQRHHMDDLLALFLLNPQSKAITHEKAEFEFGQHLKYLWNSARTLASGGSFEKYDVDELAVYTEDIYDRDPQTGAIFSLGSNGKLIYNIRHRKGDTIFDSNGNAVYKYRKGDYKRDSNGELIPVDKAYLAKQLDMMFVEGVYYFSTDNVSNTYKTTFVNTVVDWINRDIAQMNESTLEQTQVYFYPKVNMSMIKVMVNNGQVIDINALQSFKVKLYVNKQVYENTPLCLSLTASAIKVIDEHLKKDIVSMSAITAALKQTFQEDVISLSIEGLGGHLNLDTLTVLSSGDRCAIKKKLVNLGDGKLIVKEDVEVEFIRHDL